MASHTLLSPTKIAKEALRLFKNNLVMGGLVYRDYETEFPGMPKAGGSVRIRKPVQFQVAKTRVRSTKTITEQYITLEVATQAHVSWQFYTKDLTLTIEEYSERYIRPAAMVLANTVDADLCDLYKDVPNQICESTAGFVTPHSFMILGRAMQALDENAIPPDDRVVVFNPAAHWTMANALSNWNFKEGGEMALRKGYLGQIAGADIFMDQNIKAHTVGTWATDSAAMSSAARFKVQSTADSVSGAGLPTGAAVNVSQNQKILINGFNNSSGVDSLTAGDTFTIAACYAVNPMSGESTGTLRSFVVTTAAIVTVSTTDMDTMVSFYPEMIHTGPYKTVDTIPQLEAAVQVMGVPAEPYPQNLAFHKNAFALCMVPLQVPDGVWSGSASEDGYSIRVVKQYEIDIDAEMIRMDILYGVESIYPEMAVRIMGGQG